MEMFALWIGALHLAFYAVLGGMIFLGLLIEWLIDRMHWRAELLRAFARMLKDRRAALPKETHGD